MTESQFQQFDPSGDRAVFIEKMTGELSRLANDAGMGMLSYLLEMAREEAALCRSAQAAIAEASIAVAAPPRKRGRPVKRA